jgi:HD-like signal output (HDOD) protein
VRDVVAELRARFASPSYKPPLVPAIAVEVNQLAQKSSVDMTKLVAVLEKDPLLAARILKLSQSAASAPSGGITSVQSAVVRIGLRNVADLAWEVALDTRVFRSQAYGGIMEVVRKHSIVCAHLSRLTASFTSIPTDYAFLCGLLHDVGMAAGLVVLGNDQQSLSESTCADVLRACHEEASRTVAALWKLPADIQLVLGSHHSVMVDKYVHPLCAIVAVAEQLARFFNFGVMIGDVNADPTEGAALAKARNALALDEGRMEALRTQADKMMEALKPTL